MARALLPQARDAAKAFLSRGFLDENFSYALFLKIFFFLGGLALVPLVLAGTWGLDAYRDVLRRRALEWHGARARGLAERLDERIARLDGHVVFLQKSLAAELTWADKQSLFQALLEADPRLASLTLADESGKEFVKAFHPDREPALAASAELGSRAEDPLFQRFRESGGRVWELRGAESVARFRVCAPVNTATGRHALLADYGLEEFWREMAEGNAGATGRTLLTDGDGFLPVPSGKGPSVRGLGPVQSALAGRPGAMEFEDEAGRRALGASAVAAGLGGAVVSWQELDEVLAPARRARRALAWTAVRTAAGALAASLLLAGGLLRPVAALARGLEKADLSDPAVRARDALGIARSFEEGVDRLRRQAESAVGRAEAAKARTDAALSSLPDGLIVLDRAGRIRLINPAACEMLEVPDDPSALAENPLWNRLSRAPVLDALWDLAHDPASGKRRELDVSRGERRRFLEAAASPVRGAEAEGDVLLLLRDVTSGKTADKMKDDFLHSITHDLRNPMTSIRGFLKFLKDELGGPLTAQQKRMVETMDRATLRLLGMINNILDSAKLEAGKMGMNLAPTDLRETARHVLGLLQTQAAKKNLRMELDAPSAFPAAPLDPGLMERLFVNLLDNAVKFASEGSEVRVTLSEEPGWLRAEVSDTGEAIAPEFLEKIFDKFQQAGRRRGGTGLGLAICKFIVESHKGEIKARSETGRGSVFSVRLPRGLVKTPDGGVSVNGSAGSGS